MSDNDDWTEADKAADWVTENLRNTPTLSEEELAADVEFQADLAEAIEDSERASLFSDDEVEDIDELISHMDARDRYRFGGITSDD